MKNKLITAVMLLLLLGACKKEEQQPLPSPTQNNVDIQKTTGNLIVKIDVDPQVWNGASGDKKMSFYKVLGGGIGDEIYLIWGMEVENQSKYDLGEWNPGEYRIQVSGGFYSSINNHGYIQIQANKTSELTIDK